MPVARAVDSVDPGFHWKDPPLHHFVLTHEITDQHLEEILGRDESGGASELVHDECGFDVRVSEVAEEVGDTVRYKYTLVSVSCHGGTNETPTTTVVPSKSVTFAAP